MSFSKKDLNDKFISFLDQVKDEEHKSVTHLNDRVLIIDGLNTFIRSSSIISLVFGVNPDIVKFKNLTFLFKTAHCINL